MLGNNPSRPIDNDSERALVEAPPAEVEGNDYFIAIQVNKIGEKEGSKKSTGGLFIAKAIRRVNAPRQVAPLYSICELFQ